MTDAHPRADPRIITIARLVHWSGARCVILPLPKARPALVYSIN
jgi:hypothetical protein